MWVFKRKTRIEEKKTLKNTSKTTRNDRKRPENDKKRHEKAQKRHKKVQKNHELHEFVFFIPHYFKNNGGTLWECATNCTILHL